MEMIEAKILLKSLLKRVKQVDEDSFELKGLLTDDELTALKLALSVLDGNLATSTSIYPTSTKPIKEPILVALQELTPAQNPDATDNDKPISVKNITEQARANCLVELDTSVLSLPAQASDELLCLDFDTAMSKVALVKDKSQVRDLHLGESGYQLAVNVELNSFAEYFRTLDTAPTQEQLYPMLICYCSQSQHTNINCGELAKVLQNKYGFWDASKSKDKYRAAYDAIAAFFVYGEHPKDRDRYITNVQRRARFTAELGMKLSISPNDSRTFSLTTC